MTALAPAGGSLPRRRSSLVGRDHDLDAVVGLVDSRALVTLTGVGGVGKSSLALEVGRRVVTAGRPVHLADLATVTEGSSVPSVVADRMGLDPAPGVSPAEALVAALELEGTPMLVLDNSEHVRDAVADLVDELVGRVAGLTVLATSRVRLDVEGETVYPVEPLSSAPGEDGSIPAVELLSERARDAGWGSTDPEVEPALRELAERLDGVPLALELAAARLGSMSPKDLVEQLDEQMLDFRGRRRGDERHRSLGAVVEWSFHLLEPPERALLSELSVFAGGFDREAAVEVAGRHAATGVDELVEVSLVERVDVDGRTRYRMLEMIRSFAREQVGGDDDRRELALRHARWAARWALECQARMRGPQEAAMVPVLRRELPNLGAALLWAAENDEPDLVGDLACVLGDHVYTRAGREVDEWIDHAVRSVADPYGIEDLLGVAALCAQRRGDLQEADRLVTESEARGFQGARLLAGTGLMRVVLLAFTGRFEEASARAAELAAAGDDDTPVGALTYSIATLPMAYRGEYGPALEMAAEAVRRADRTGWPTALAAARYAEAEALIGTDRQAAIRAHRETARVAESVENRFFRGVNMVSWASAVGRFGDPVDALALFDEAIDYFGSMGAWSYLSTTLRNLGELLVRLERYEDSFVIRTALAHLTGSTSVAGVDADRDAYLTALLRDRILPDRCAELDREAAELSREEVIRRAGAVVDEELAARRPGPAIRAVVFTDLEGATGFMAEHGDTAARTVMRRYEELTEQLLTEFRGHRVKGTGDGTLVTFASVSDALQCAGRLLAHIEDPDEDLPLRVRVGVHAGEMIDETDTEEGDDIHGTVVNLAARVVDRADGGEVVVTDTVRQIVAGSGFSFDPMGVFTLKGIPEPVALHRFAWRSSA